MFAKEACKRNDVSNLATRSLVRTGLGINLRGGHVKPVLCRKMRQLRASVAYAGGSER